MIKTKTVCVCDVCGRIVDAVARSGQYNETEYDLPKDWSKGSVNNGVDICPDCKRKLSKPMEIYRMEQTARQINSK